MKARAAYSANEVDPAGEAELHNASWVGGAFGTALRFSGSESYATLPTLPALDGADEMSLSVWVYWEGTGQYPNIVTGGTWSPGGFLIFVNNGSCSFRMGRPGHRHGAAAEAWTEVSSPLLSDLPMKQWVHLAAVFKRPQITTYVNGKQVGSARWDYPVGHRGDLEVGRWTGSVSHAGLIDEVRIYRRALAAEEILALADPAGRQSPEYKQLGPAKPNAKELARFETRWATLVVGDDGTILSLREKPSGRELLAAPESLLSVELASQRRLVGRRLRLADGLLVADFPRVRQRGPSHPGRGAVFHRHRRRARRARREAVHVLPDRAGSPGVFRPHGWAGFRRFLGRMPPQPGIGNRHVVLGEAAAIPLRPPPSTAWSGTASAWLPDRGTN